MPVSVVTQQTDSTITEQVGGSTKQTRHIASTVHKKIVTFIEGPHEAWMALIILSVLASVLELGAAAGMRPANFWEFLQTASYLLSISAAALIGGVFIGFLFGIPRTMSGSRSGEGHADDSNAKAADGGSSSMPGLGPNTNLEQISDWLTKILVGVGLTQIGKLSDALKTLGAAIAPGLKWEKGGGVLGVAAVLFYSICGFLIGYLWTRIYLTQEFGGVEAKLRQLSEKMTSVQKQPEKDAIALGLAQKLMNPATSAGQEHIDQRTLDKAVYEASQAMKIQIFYEARRRRKDLKDLRDKEARTPDLKDKPDRGKEVAGVTQVLRALQASDTTERYHRTHAQLAYALAEQTPRDLEGALEAIEEAIKIRDKLGMKDYWNYEMFRALCNIARFSQASASEIPDIREQILSDLRAVMVYDAEGLSKDQRVNDWLAKEKLTLGS